MHTTVLAEGGPAVRHEAEFFGPQGARCFGALMTPLDTPTAGVVVCSPTQAEFPKNYRRELLLSRLLAERGVAVQRFHYRGAGHSDGDAEDLSFETMLIDTLAASERLRRLAGVTSLAFLGTRVGALVAAAAAAELDAVALALWDPVVDPSGYLREVLRARLMSELAGGATTPTSEATLLEELERKGWVDVLGYSVHRSLHESLRGRGLVRQVGPGAQAVLLVELTARSELAPPLVDLERAWGERGVAVTTAVTGKDEAWWFTQEGWWRDKKIATGTPLLDVTATWLAGQLQGAGAVA